LLDANVGKCIHTWHGHSYEAWIAAFVAANVVWTGADDCCLKEWDIRTANRGGHDGDKLNLDGGHGGDGGMMTTTTMTTTMRLSNAKEHTMGVCSIHRHPHAEYVVATGSYDEQVRLWDRRRMSSAIESYSCKGGVWRLKWSESGDKLLAAAMHNGFHVLNYSRSLVARNNNDTNDDNNNNNNNNNDHNNDDRTNHYLSLCKHYVGKHTSLAYGADWVDETTVASCSFYDQWFSIWTL